MPIIRRIFKQKVLPTDLAYLPHVESSFNTAAYSKFGAAGIWQFTRSTGRRYMTIDYTIDERRDPILSSLAAAELLKDNYKKLGEWPLALTAYNHGASGMMRAKRKYGTYEAIFKHHRSRLFGFASRNFYSEFLAAREVARNYERHFGKLNLHQPVDYPEIVLPGYMALDDLVTVLKVNAEEIQRLNPSLRKPVCLGEKYIPKGFRLRLPTDTLVASKGSRVDFPPETIKASQKRSLFYRVEKGDTAGKIARMHRVSLHDLIMANNLGRRAIIYPGQNLRLPGSGEKPSVLAHAGTPRKKDKATASPEPVFSEPPEDETTRSPSSPDAETPEASLASLPPEVETAAASPSPEVETDAAPVFAAKTKAPPPEPKINPTLVIGNLKIERVTKRKGRPIGVIQVAVEETLGHYADWLQVSASEIRHLNGIRFGQPIRIHQKVKIPLHKIAKDAFEEKRFEYHQELVQDFFSAFRVDQVQTYHIRRGDNIWKLCYEVFEVPLWLFQTYNAGLNLSDLRMSQMVRIPVIEKIASG
jgi:membrane-bound lytic murein transglycosylase D